MRGGINADAGTLQILSGKSGSTESRRGDDVQMADGMNELVSFLENRFCNQIKARSTLPATAGEFVDFPAGLDPRLQAVLREQGIGQLYGHQADAYREIAAGRDAVLVSRTASGKTLSFLLPILNAYLQADTPFTVLLLYPTKALSRDQEGTLGKLLRAAAGNQPLGTFDGDTPREERRNIQRRSDFVITNPDMLHSGILPNHNRAWKSFLSRLRFIVVDEVHVYRGAFGSHVSNVFRRLLRVCEMHGGKPQFVCSSATVGNPGDHVGALFHREFSVINRDCAPRPRRDLYFINPALVQSAGAAMYRKGTGSVSVGLIRRAAQLGVRTICFCRARQEVERLYRAVTDRHPELRGQVKPYRGGLLPNERRQLERDLFEGRISAIITTNALELGIDIGDLDLCILSGHPGSVASFWQQAGRVGRKGAHAVIVYVAKDQPVDQYLVNHPQFIANAPIEQAWLNADNPYILLQHLPCAAYEHPLRPEEPLFSGDAFPMAVDVLAEDKVLVPYRDCWRYALSDYPARGVNLRGMTDFNVEIYCGSDVIGEIDPIGARGTLYKDAIYQHLGERYMSMDLDLEKKLCRVERVDVDYYTEAVWQNRIEMLEVAEEKEVNEASLRFGYVHVNKQPKLYKKIRERTFENIGYGPITLPAFEYDTTGFSMLPPASWKKAVSEADPRYVGAALFGLSYILKHTAPSLCLADITDIATDVFLHEEIPAEWRSALYLYDTHEGGVGYSEKIFELITEAFQFCLDIIEECECAVGCPSCVPGLPPGVDTEEMEELLIESDAAVQCTRSLLMALLGQGITVPDVHSYTSERPAALTPPPVDEEKLKLGNRLSRASEILRKKRERLH